MNNLHTLVDVSIFKLQRSPTETRVGSTVVYPYGNESLTPVEIGAFIFVKANKNLWRATEEFNLTRRDFKDLNYEIGIWDGEAIVISVCAEFSSC